MGMSYRLAY